MAGTDQNAVEVVLRANTSALVAGMKEAASATASSGAAMREEIANLGTSSHASAGGLNVLTDSLKEWRTHVRTEAKYTNFMAQQIAGLGISSKGAAAELTGLISGFAFGNWLGLAVEGVKLIAHAFHGLEEAEKAAAEELKKYSDDLIKGTQRIELQAQVAIMAAQGASKAQIQAFQEIKPLQQEREELAKKIAKAEQDVLEALEGKGALVAELGPKAAEIDQKQLDRDRELLRSLDEQIRRRQVARGLERTAQLGPETAKEEEDEDKENAKKEKLRKDHLARVHAAEGAAQVALDKMVTEHTAQRVQIDKNYEAIEDTARAEKKKKSDDYFKELKKQIHETIAESTRFGQAFGTAFAGVIAGTESVSKAFANMAKAALHAIFDQVRKAIEAYALQAAAAAAAANAGVPGIGWALAAAAAAAVEGFVMGLLDQLPSAAGGWSVPHDTIAMVHAGEHILPAPIAQKYEDGAPGGGGGGGDTHVHFHGLVDSNSFRQWWNNPQNVREFEDAVRRGRLRT